MQVLQLALGVAGQVGVARVAEAAYGVVSGAPVIGGLLVIREARSGRLIDRDHHAVRDVAKASEQLEHTDATDQYRHHQPHPELSSNPPPFYMTTSLDSTQATRHRWDRPSLSSSSLSSRRATFHHRETKYAGSQENRERILEEGRESRWRAVQIHQKEERRSWILFER